MCNPWLMKPVPQNCRLLNPLAPWELKNVSQKYSGEKLPHFGKFGPKEALSSLMPTLGGSVQGSPRSPFPIGAFFCPPGSKRKRKGRYYKPNCCGALGEPNSVKRSLPWFLSNNSLVNWPEFPGGFNTGNRKITPCSARSPPIPVFLIFSRQ